MKCPTFASIVELIEMFQALGCLDLSKPHQIKRTQPIKKLPYSLRVINNEIYCCSLNSIEVYSQDLHQNRSIYPSPAYWYHDVAERDEEHLFIAKVDGLFVFTKSGNINNIMTS